MLLFLLLLLLLHCSCCYNIIGTVFVTVNKLGLGLKSVIYIYIYKRSTKQLKTIVNPALAKVMTSATIKIVYM